MRKRGPLIVVHYLITLNVMSKFYHHNPLTKAIPRYHFTGGINEDHPESSEDCRKSYDVLRVLLKQSKTFEEDYQRLLMAIPNSTKCPMMQFMEIAHFKVNVQILSRNLCTVWQL